MRFNQVSLLSALRHHRQSLKLTLLLGATLLICGIQENAWGQSPAYAQVMGYGQQFNPYQQAGLQQFAADGTTNAGYATMDGASESQISYEYIERQRKHGKYAREGYENGETPFDNVFKNVLDDTWLRLEYLNWSIKGPGDKSFGASTNLTTGNAANPFLNIPDQYGGLVLVTTSVPDASRIDLPSNNGFRASTGIDLAFGELEASVFVLEQAKSFVDYSHFINNVAFVPNTISQTYLQQGQVSNLSFSYDRGYYASYTSQVFGADANVHFDIRNVDLGLNHDVLAGFRFIHLSERLQQLGQFDNFGAIQTVNVEYDSSTRNNIYGPQLGFRSEFKHQLFTLGVQNKIMAGFNYLETSLDEAIFDVNGGTLNSLSSNSTQFAAAYDLNVYGKIKISEHFKINVGYNFLWVGRVSRPADNIIYDTDISNVADSELQVNNADFYVHGLSLGTEITF